MNILLRLCDQRWILWAAILSMAAAGILIALVGPIDLITNGPFLWHIKQPEATQGAMELAVVSGLTFLAVYFFRRTIAIIVVIVIAEIYARRHGFDVDFALSLLYVEGIIALGILGVRMSRGSEVTEPHDFIYSIVLGLLLWSFALWSVSAVGYGSVVDLRVLTLLVLPLCLIKVGRLPLSAYATSGNWNRSLVRSLLATFVVVAILMLFAKARVSMTYDSLWYGIRGDRVLVAAGSVFKSLGLVTSVHYYPKAYELLLVPLSGAGAVTLILGFSIWMWAIFGVLIQSIFVECDMRLAARTAGVTAILSIPVFMNIAITSKGDIAAAILTVLACYAMMCYRQSDDSLHLWVAFSGLIVAPLFRLSVLPYIGALGIIWLWWAGARLLQRNGMKTKSSSPRLSLIFVSTAAIVFLLVEARTILLAGVPIVSPRSIVAMEQWMGFGLNYPVGMSPDWSNARTYAVLGTVWDFLFHPSALPHVMMRWTGSVWLAAILLGLVAWGCKRPRFTSTLIPFLAIIITAIGILAFKRFGMRGGDGNYYLVPIACLTILGFWWSSAILDSNSAAGRGANLVTGLFVVTGMMVALVTGAWGPGTLRWDTNFSRTPFDQRPRAIEVMRAQHLQPIYEYLEKLPAATRVVGQVSGQLNTSGWFPTRYESLWSLVWSNPSLVASDSSFMEFVSQDKISYVLLPKNTEQMKPDAVATRARMAMKNFEARGKTRVVASSDRYQLWMIENN